LIQELKQFKITIYLNSKMNETEIKEALKWRLEQMLKINESNFDQKALIKVKRME
jgi:hypothetical protein